MNFQRLPSVIFECVNSALNPRSFVGGAGVLAIKEGFARGILSNEAGAGTSAMAHSTAEGSDPHRAGLFAMTEVFFDTLLLCPLTGLAILSSCPDLATFTDPMLLVASAFSPLGPICHISLPLVILSFAFATILCWYYYGARCFSTLFGLKSALFAPLYILSLTLSRFIPGGALLVIMDSLLLFMSLISLATVIKRSSYIIDVKKTKGR